MITELLAALSAIPKIANSLDRLAGTVAQLNARAVKATDAVKDAFKDESMRGQRGAWIGPGEIAEALGTPTYPDIPELPDPVMDMSVPKAERRARTKADKARVADLRQEAKVCREAFLEAYETCRSHPKYRDTLMDMHAHAAAIWRDYVECVYALERFKPLPEESPLPETISTKSKASGVGRRITRRELEALKGEGIPPVPTPES